MATRKTAQNLSDQVNRKATSDSPLSFKNILAGIIVTVLGGIILAYIIQDARFSRDHFESIPTLTPTVAAPFRIPSTISTLAPNSTQVANSSTLIVSIDEQNTSILFDGELFITVRAASLISQIVSATIGSPGCVNQEFESKPIGYAVIYECNKQYDIRVSSIKRRDNGFWALPHSVLSFTSQS